MYQDIVPAADLNAVKELTARFVSQWETGKRPRLKEYASTLSGPARRILLHELIGIDADYRSRAGERPSHDDYRDMFPELDRDELERLTTRYVSSSDAMADPVAGDPKRGPPVPPPAQLIRFEKIRQIGKGGMGEVWKAVQLSTGRTVALKELPAGDLGSATARAKFEEEILWASQMQHPNIARVYDSGLLEGSYYYAMELIQGERLDRHAEKNRWTIRKMLETMRVIAGTVHYAHERHILHLDLKPSNILVEAQGKPIILDFGLARALRGNPGDTSPRYGNVVGTPAFMAPEQVLGREDRINRATDIYSLGVILYQFVTGELPRQPKQPFEKWQQEVMDEKIPPPLAINRDIGKNLNALIMKCLATDPADRYPDAKQLQTDIDHLLSGSELTARPLNWAGRVQSWCCSPDRLLQAGNFKITLGAILAPFHVLAISHGIAKSLGFLSPYSNNLRLREFIPMMIGFLLFDMYLIFSGFLVRRKSVRILWLDVAIALCWLAWLVCVLFGVIAFDTGGAVASLRERFPLYLIFTGIGIIGCFLTCFAISAYYAHRSLDQALRQSAQS